MKSVSAILVLAVAAFVIAIAPMAWAADVVQGTRKDGHARQRTNCKRLIGPRHTASLSQLEESLQLRAVTSMNVRSGLPR